GDLGAHLYGGRFGGTEYGATLVILRSMRGALSVEPLGGLLPAFRLPFGPLGLAVEPGEFFGDQPHGAVSDEAAHGFVCCAGGVVEAAVCRVAFHRFNELRSGVGHVPGDDVQAVRVAASGHADVDACRA